MDRFKNILVAASPGHLESSTVDAAVKLAETNDARLTVLDVIAPLPTWRKKMTLEGRVIDVEKALLRDREERLRHLMEDTRGGLDIEVMVKVGEPFIEVIRQVLANDHDLVMMGEPEGERETVAPLSSGVMHMLRKCPVPVWVMRPSLSPKLRILALVDPDPVDQVRNSLNDLVLELATSLTRREDAELHVGHAWRLSGEATLRSSPYVGLSGEIVDVMVGTVEETHREQLNALTERHQVADMGGLEHMVAGDPRIVLPRLADRLNIGLIVMGTVARTGLSGLIMGNTAEAMLRSVQCSVLAVKPEGFVTPVKPARHGT
jgi:nucleotide-binding universal stress UspA family protein